MDSDLDWISRLALEQLTGAHRTTVDRWKINARAGRLPRWLQLLVNTVWRGQLDAIHANWRGWIINRRDGDLVTPEGICVTQGQIRALPHLYALRDALEVELRQLRAAIRPPVPHQRIRRSTAQPSSTSASTSVMGGRRRCTRRVAVTCTSGSSIIG